MNAHAMYNAVENQDHDDLVVNNAKLVKRIAFHLMNRLPPSVQAEDLIQAGMIGLIDAARNYDPSQGASFETYAGIRVRGAMLDEIRRSDWTPRSVHRKSREAAEVIRRFEQRVGRDANDAEVAAELGISLQAYHQILTESTSAHIFSFDQPDEQTGEPIALPKSDEVTPVENMENDSFQEALAKCIKNLPERESLVMSLYYDEDLNLREIGEILGVSESRVCQIHGQALVRLRARLSEWTQPDE
ncbi:RNA polymerase sigma factor FliA [Granulosicoccaceae sp. 1_MG-2023]|nr:RNA polymerase sigma factor FliA [Granulosicoccaceae sp. 1_MG-2023]